MFMLSSPTKSSLIVLSVYKGVSLNSDFLETSAKVYFPLIFCDLVSKKNICKLDKQSDEFLTFCSFKLNKFSLVFIFKCPNLDNKYRVI